MAKSSCRNFWQTSVGMQANEVMYSHEEEEDVSYAIADNEGDGYVAGSALQAARRGNQKDSIQ